MRILVLSDIHGDFHSMNRALALQPTAEAVIFCGDGAEQFAYMQETLTDKTVIGVRGNCDWSSDLPPAAVAELGGKRIFVTHGHLYNVKFTMDRLVYAAREQQADILLFGHTHQAMTDHQDGLTIMNPGSCHGYGATCGIIDITNKGDVVTNIFRVDSR